MGALAAGLVGCGQKPDSGPSPASNKGTSTPASLRLLVVEDPALSDAISSLWKAQLESEVELVTLSREDLTKAKRISADVLIFPANLVGTLVERGLIDPIQQETLEDESLSFRDIWQATRTNVCRYGGSTYGVPLSSPTWMLTYRQDLFTDLGITPPTTWNELLEVEKRLADWTSKEPGRSALALPLSDHWSGTTLLVFAATYLADAEQVSPLFDPNTVAPLVNLPPMLKGLETLVAAAQSPEGRLDPMAAWLAVAQGKSAMAITWAPVGLPADTAAEHLAQIAYAAVPGAKERYDFSRSQFAPLAEAESPYTPLVGAADRLVAISSSAGQLRLAERFLGWISSESNLQTLSNKASSVGLVRPSMKASAAKWIPSGSSKEAATQYGNLLAQAANSTAVLGALRIPGAEEYMAALDLAVSQALSGTAPQTALDQAQQTFTNITQRLGTEAQLRSLKRSMGQRVS